MQVTDYTVTELFGCQDGYPLNQNLCPPGQGFHKGIDYGCPTGTPIVVNGVDIGISGATGAVTGPHVHIGKWDGGTVLDPGVGNGLSFKSAVVSDIGEDATNGKYVKVKGDGYTWVYLHMSNNNLVTVGQVLQGGDMPIPASEDLRYIMFRGILRREPTLAEMQNQNYANDVELLGDTLWNNGGKALYEAGTSPPTGTVLAPGTYVVK